MFTEWFKQEAVAQYHRVILAEDFMEHLAPKHWPVGHRIGFCWLPPNSDAKCVMKEGEWVMDDWRKHSGTQLQ